MDGATWNDTLRLEHQLKRKRRQKKVDVHGDTNVPIIVLHWEPYGFIYVRLSVLLSVTLVLAHWFFMMKTIFEESSC